MTDKPRWTCGYAGATDYVFKGRKYVVRSHSMGSGFGYNAGVLETQIALTGTIRCSDRSHEFPPAEVCAFFPGWIPARFTDDWQIEYQGGVAPQVVPDPLCRGGDGVSAMIWCQNRDAWDAFSAELHTLIDLVDHYSTYSRFRETIEWDAATPTDSDIERVRALKEKLTTELQVA